MLQSAVATSILLKNGQTTFGKETKVRRLSLQDVIDIKVGANSTAVLKKNNLTDNDGLFFSIITKHRTLDLKANEV